MRAPDVVLLAGGRVKHMSLGMNAVLARYFNDVQPQLARQKSRILLARHAKPVGRDAAVPVTEFNERTRPDGLRPGRRFCRHRAGHRHPVPAGVPAADARTPPRAVDLGCGTGILAAMYARNNPAARVTATDRSAAAVDSALATAQANGLADQITVLQDDAMSTLPGRQRRPDPAQPAVPPRRRRPRRGGYQAVRGSRPGPGSRRGALDGVQQPPALPAGAGAADRTHPRGRPEPEIHGDGQRPAACGPVPPPAREAGVCVNQLAGA